MSIDKWDWHYDDYSHLKWAEEYCMCLLGLYMVWCILHNLHSNEQEYLLSKEQLNLLTSRKISISDFFEQHYDGKLWDDCFNEKGLAFTKEYYDTVLGEYYDDFFDVADESLDWSSIDVQWGVFNKVDPLIQERYDHWVTLGSKKKDYGKK